MSRRVVLPGAAELFRQTSPHSVGRPSRPALRAVSPADADEARVAAEEARAAAEEAADVDGPSALSRAKRQRHDTKITVYLSTDELVALESARLTLRAEFGIAVDRSRIVREAVFQVLDDLAVHGYDSVLVRRFGGR